MLKIVTTLLALALGILSAWASPREDCFSGVAEPDVKIAGCTVLLQKKSSNRDQANQYNNRCIGYSNKGDYEHSVADCTKAIELDPNFSFAFNNRCLAYNKLGKYDLAAADCTKSLDLKNPGPQFPYKNRGDAYAGKGDYDQAIADYTRAIELLPSYDQARQALAQATKQRDEQVNGPLAAKGQGAVDVVPLVPHSQVVDSIAFSPNGALILSGSKDGKLKLWEASNGRLIRTMRGHTDGVASVAFSPDGKWALSGGADTGVKLWDVASGEFIRHFYGHTKAVTAVAFAPDGKRFASASYDNTVVVWDTVTGNRLLTFRGHVGSVTAVAFSPDGTRILSGAWTNLYPQRNDNSAKLWDAATGRVIQTFQHTDMVGSVSFSPDGTRVLTGSNDKTMKLWDAASGRLLHSFGGYSYEVYSVAFSPDGADVLSANLDGIKVYEAAGGRSKHIFETDGIKSSAISFDGTRLVTGTFNGAVKLWDLGSGRLTFDAGNASSGDLTAVGFASDGAHIVSGSQSELRLWDIPTGMRVLTGDSARIAVSHDGNRLLVGGYGTLKVVDAATGQDIRVISGIPNALETVAISPDGQRIVAGLGWDRNTGAAERGKFEMWDTSSGKLLMAFRGHGGGVNRPAFKGIGVVAFSPDGARIVTGGDADGTSTNAPIGNGKLRFWDPATGQLLRSIDAHYYAITSLAISPDGSRIATGSGYDQVTQGRLITSIQTLRIWDAKSGKMLHSIGPNAAVNAVAFSPDGQQVLSGSDDNQLILWDGASGQIVRRFDGHSGSITAVSFSSDGERVLSASGDRTLKIWNRGTGALLVTLIGTADGEWLELTPEGFFAASSGGGRLLTVVRGLELWSIDQFYQALYRPDLVREKLAGDPRGLVRQAAQQLNLDNVTASGNAPGVRVSIPGRAVGPVNVDGTTATAEAEITDRGGGIGRVEWRVNGVTFGVDTPAAATPSPLRLTRSIALEQGDNAIEVTAYNSANLVASVAARLSVVAQVPAPAAAPQPVPSAAPVAAAKPRLFVLAAGVNDYADQRFKLEKAVWDAQEIARGFKESGGSLYQSVDVKLMIDADVTQSKLDAAFGEIAAKAAATDVFVLYLAGHGKTVDGRYYFVPQDFTIEGELSEQSINAAVKAKGVAQEQWQRWFAEVPARKSVMLFDTCESGTLADDETQQLQKGAANDRLVQATGRSILAASGGSQEALEGYHGHGLFTYEVLDAINDADGDRNGTIELNELAAYVYAQVSEVSQKVFKQRQVPQMKLTSNYPLAKQMRILEDETTPVAAAKPIYQVSQAAQLQVQPGPGATVVRSLFAKTDVTVLESKNGWSLVASEGKPIGYVATRDLAPVQ
jgi:WD40 repeat protein/uncharacterized caspase-like protein